MKATFKDFITENLNCTKFSDNTGAQNIFDLLSEDDSIISMVDATEAGRPALSPCVNRIEDYYDKQNAPNFDLKDGFTRTVVGRMVKTILAPFGYEPSVQKDLPRAVGARYFTSASCYTKTGIASMRIVKTIVEN